MKLRRVATGLALGAVALSVAVVVTLRSDWFREQVRLKLIHEIGAATGARVEIGSFGYNWRNLEVELKGVVLHGREQPSQAPFFLARRIRLTLGPATIFERRLDLRQLRVEKPEVHVYVAADGTTNLPRPATPAKGNVIEDLLRLKVGEAEIVEGQAEVALRRFDFAGRIFGFDTKLRYAAGPDRYESLLKIERIETSALPALGLQGSLALEAKRLSAHDLRVSIQADGKRHSGGGTWVVVNGALQDFVHPSAAGTYTAELDIVDLPSTTLPSGTFKLGGNWSWSPEDWRATATVHAKGLDFVIVGRHSMVDTAEGRCELGRRGIRCGALRAAMLGGAFAGSAGWLDWERLEIAGAIQGAMVQRVRPLLDFLPAAWDGRATGNAHFEAAWTGADLSGTVLGGKLQVTPAPGAWPLQGNIDFVWRDASDQVLFGPSTLDSQSTHVTFEGELDRRLKVTASTSDIQDLEHGLRLGFQRDDISLPFRLDHGTAQASGTLDGPILKPAAVAQFHASNLTYKDVRFDAVEASAEVSSNHVLLKNCRVRREGSAVSGSVSASLSEWRLTGGSAIQGDLTLKKTDLGVLARTLGAPASIAGTADIVARFRGTYDRPEATVQLDAPEIRWQKEILERVKGTLRFHNDGHEVLDADVTADGAQIVGKGSYDHPSGNWSDGRLTFEAHVSKLAFAKIESLMAVRPGLDGVLEAELSGALRVTDGTPRPESLSGRLTAENVTLDGEPLGRAEALLRPEAGKSTFELNALLEGTRVIGFGTLGYGEDYLL